MKLLTFQPLYVLETLKSKGYYEKTDEHNMSFYSEIPIDYKPIFALKYEDTKYLIQEMMFSMPSEPQCAIIFESNDFIEYDWAKWHIGHIFDTSCDSYAEYIVPRIDNVIAYEVISVLSAGDAQDAYLDWWVKGVPFGDVRSQYVCKPWENFTELDKGILIDFLDTYDYATGCHSGLSYDYALNVVDYVLNNIVIKR
jgi:ABC-type cobalt transport system substrate-binding protein